MPDETKEEVEEKVEETTEEVVEEKSDEQASDPEPEAASDEDAAAGDEAAKAIAEAYTPNFKFKVLDEEKEFDDWIRPAINKENESKVRELFEKAYGLDTVKGKLQSERAEREKYQGEFENLAGQVQAIMGLRKQDLGKFFAKTGLSRDEVLRWALREAERQEALKDLPPEVKEIYNKFGTIETQNEELRQQIEAIQNGHFDTSVQARTRELDTVLSRPEVLAMASEYDARAGKPGAFRKQVIRHGQAEFQDTQRDLSAEEAVKEVVSILGLSQAASPAAKPNESAAPTKKVIVQAKPNVLPNVGAGASSASAMQPKSIDDLRKLAKAAANG